jgi:hypothetical protein
MISPDDYQIWVVHLEDIIIGIASNEDKAVSVLNKHAESSKYPIHYYWYEGPFKVDEL